MAKTVKAKSEGVKTLKTTLQKEKPKATRHKDHDTFLRGIFDHLEFVLKILHYVIPEDLKPFVDFASLKQLPDMHVSTRMLISQSDTIYEAKLNENALPDDIRNDEELPKFRFCFLGEFKSSKPSQPIDFQIDGYIRSIQKKDIVHNRPPSIVVPLLIYHGAETWENKRLFDKYKRFLPPTIMEYIAFPKYLVIDIQAMTDELIKNAEDLGELRAAFLALKHAHDKKYFTANLLEMTNFVNRYSKEVLVEAYLELLMEYFQRRSGKEDKVFKKFVQQLNNDPDMLKEVNGYKLFLKEAKEEAAKEGLAKGLEAGLEKGLEKGQAKAVIPMLITKRFSDAEIAEMLKMQLSFINNIRQIMDFCAPKMAFTDEEIAEKLALSIDFVQFVRNESAIPNT